MNNSIDALWLAQFAACEGTSGTGIVMLKNNKIFGGDSAYYYLGEYTAGEGKISGQATSVHYAGPSLHLFGQLERANLKFDGKYDDITMTMSGYMLQDPSHTFQVQLTKCAELP